MKNKKIYLSFFLIVALSCSESKNTKQNNEVKSEIKKYSAWTRLNPSYDMVMSHAHESYCF